MTTQLSTSTNPLPDRWIDALFVKMINFYGSKFTEMWRDTDIDAVKAMWAHELGKLSREEVTRGAQALMTLEWPPSLPQFMKLCRVQIDPQKAFVEALNGLVARDRGEVGVWSHPAIFWAAVSVGGFDMKNSTYLQIQARWRVALEDELAKGDWAEIPKPVVALPAIKVAADVAQKYLAQLQPFSAESNGVDHKRWAKRILERHAQGDKRLLPIQVSMAQAALKAPT